jgi:Flp pilus assembly protein TadD
MVYKYLGDLQYRCGKYSEAKKANQKYMSLAEESNDNIQRYALILFYNREFREAAEQLKKVVLKDPSNPYMNRIMAYVSFETGDFENGMKSITKFFESKDTIKLLATDYLYYGKLLLKTGNDSSGIVNIKKALQMDEAKTDAYKDLAVALSKHKKHDDAIVIYEKLISKGVDKPNSYFNIAKEYYYKGQNHKDIYNSSVLMAGATADKNLISYNDSILAIQSFTRADSFFSLVTIISPDFADGYLWKGRMLSLIDVNMEKGLAKEPYEKALSLLEKNNAVQNVGKITECYKYLAAYNYYQSEYLANSDKNLSASLKTRAIEYYQKIVSLNPADVQAKDVLNELTKPPVKSNMKKRPQ